MHDEIVHVVGENFVHARCAEHYAAAQRHAAADKSRACAARSHGDVVFIAKAHYLRDFLGALDLADDLRIVFAVNRHFVVAEIVLHRILGEKALRADDGLKLLSNLRRGFVILRHFRPPYTILMHYKIAKQGIAIRYPLCKKAFFQLNPKALCALCNLIAGQNYCFELPSFGRARVTMMPTTAISPARMKAMDVLTAFARKLVPIDAIPKPIITSEQTRPAFFEPR